MSRLRLALLAALAVALALPRPVAAAPSLNPTRLELPHGLVAYVLPRHDQPVVAMHLGIRAGTMEEGPEELGAAAMLTRGAASQSAEAIAARLDALGGGFGIEALPDRAELAVEVLKQDWPAALALAGEVLAHPTFDPAELAKARELAAGQLASTLDEPTEVATLAGWQALYGRGPLGRPAVGGQDALAKLSSERLKRFHATRYVPAGAIMVVVGDVTPAEVKRQVARAFADWVPTGPLERPRLLRQDTARGAMLVPLDVSQANMHLSYPGVGPADPSYPALVVATQILGGGYLSRLYKKVREELGLAYHARARLHTWSGTGAMAIELQTKASSAELALKTTLAQIEDLRSRPVASAELDAVKRYLIGKFPRTLETNGDCAEALLDTVMAGLPIQTLERTPQRIAAVTAGQVQQTAMRLWAPERRMVTMAGPAGPLAPLLSRYGQLLRVDPRALIR